MRQSTLLALIVSIFVSTHTRADDTKFEKLVAADLNGTWKFTQKSELISSTTIRVSTVVDVERLSLWVVEVSGNGSRSANEYMLTDVLANAVVFVRHVYAYDTRSSYDESVTYSITDRTITIERVQPEHMTIPLDKRPNLSRIEEWNKWRSQHMDPRTFTSKLQKFTNSVALPELRVASDARVKEMQTSPHVTVNSVPTRTAIGEFLAALQPLADGALREYGAKFASDDAIRAEDVGMAAAFTLLKLSGSAQ